MTAAATRTCGAAAGPGLDRAILAAAEQQLRELGYAGMSLESVAAAAGTTVPSCATPVPGQGRPGRRGHRLPADRGACPPRPGPRGHAPWRSCGISTTTCGGRTRWRSSARCWPKSGAIRNCSAPSAAASSSRAGRCSATPWPTPSRPANYRSPRTRRYSPACSSAPSTPATWLPPTSLMTGQSGRCGKPGQTRDTAAEPPYRLIAGPHKRTISR